MSLINNSFYYYMYEKNVWWLKYRITHNQKMKVNFLNVNNLFNNLLLYVFQYHLK